MTAHEFFKSLAQKFGYTNACLRQETPGTCCYELALTKKNKTVGAIRFSSYGSSWICDNNKEEKDELLNAIAQSCIDGNYCKINFIDYMTEGPILHQTSRCVSCGKFNTYEDIIANAHYIGDVVHIT